MWGGGYNRDNIQATSARLFFPTAVALHSIGNLYIANSNDHRIWLVTKVSGIITTVAGH